MRSGRKKEICKRFSTPAERGGEKNENEGARKRNSDHVLRQSISAAANGWSEKMKKKGQQLWKWPFCLEVAPFSRLGEFLFLRNLRIIQAKHQS